jgi:hypothetical protein
VHGYFSVAYITRSSFRLEVRVTTPHFEICELDKAGRASVRPMSRPLPSGTPNDYSQRVAITGSLDSRRQTLSRLRSASREASDDEDDEDLVSWASLLSSLHDRQQLQIYGTIAHRRAVAMDIPVEPVKSDTLVNIDQRHALVCIKPVTRSWDLMPPDVVRPMASTTLGTLITIAHRMGMSWQDMIPREGKIRAESIDESLSATLMRGLGLVVEYNLESKTPSMHDTLYVPSSDADKVCINTPSN